MPRLPLSTTSAPPPAPGRRRPCRMGTSRWIAAPPLGHSHAPADLQEPAGGGAVVAVQMARLQPLPVHSYGVRSYLIGEARVQRLEDLGLDVHVAWREAPTRRGSAW